MALLGVLFPVALLRGLMGTHNTSSITGIWFILAGMLAISLNDVLFKGFTSACISPPDNTRELSETG